MYIAAEHRLWQLGYRKKPNLKAYQSRAHKNTRMCFEGKNLDGSPATGRQIEAACEDIALLAEQMKANNICLKPTGFVVDCPEG